jgi:hypothetical protein
VRQPSDREIKSPSNPGRKRQPGHKRYTQPIRHHLDRRMQRGGGETVVIAVITGQETTRSQCLVSKAMAFLQEQQTFGTEAAYRNRFNRCQGMVAGHGNKKLIPRNRNNVCVAAMAGKSQQQKIEAIADQPLDETGCRIFA